MFSEIGTAGEERSLCTSYISALREAVQLRRLHSKQKRSLLSLHTVNILLPRDAMHPRY